MVRLRLHDEPVDVVAADILRAKKGASKLYTVGPDGKVAPVEPADVVFHTLNQQRVAAHPADQRCGLCPR